MSDPRHRLGDEAETLVARALVTAGWTVLARRWRVPEGEIDIVCLDPSGALVAVEVKARRSVRSGSALESVDGTRVRRLRSALRRYAVEARVGHRGLRIDLVTVERRPEGWRARRLAGIDGW
jgi:putative endonuclease